MRLKSLVLLCFIICPTIAIADGDNSWHILQIPASDYSIYMLGLIFGPVGGFIHGNSALFSQLFSAFNNVILMLGGVAALYSLIVGTLNSAADGEALGRKWSSYFTPLRVAFGFLLMAPGTSGYSLIQIFFLWVGTQGIGAADTMWTESVDYLMKGGTVFQGVVDHKPVYTMSGNILKGLVCAEMLNYYANSDLQGQVNVPLYSHKPGSRNFQFPGKVTVSGVKTQPGYASSWQGACGQLSWTAAADKGQAYIEAGLTQMIQALSPVAKQIIEQKFSDRDLTLAQQSMVIASRSYISVTQPILDILNATAKGLSVELAEQMKKEGWIMAGSYYYKMFSLTRTVSSLPDIYIPTWQTQQIDGNSTKSHFINPFGSSPNIVDYLHTYTNLLEPTIKKTIIFQSKGDDPLGQTYQGINLDSTSDVSGAPGAIFSIMTLGLSDVVYAWRQYFGYTTNDQNQINPLVRVAMFGDACMEAANQAWVVGAMVFFGLGMLGGLVPCISAAMTIVVMWIMPIIAVLMTSLLVAGFTLGYFLPMMPFIIFTFGGLGWMVAVIESVCAAPLVAFGIAYPEGSNSLYGTTEPAIMLLVAVFLRPCLMLVGLFASMILCFVSVFMFNAGFSIAFNQMLISTGVSLSIYATVSLILVYTYGLITVMKKTFSLIDIIPDKVLNWVAGGRGFAPRFGESSKSMYRDLESSLGGGVQKIAEGHSQGVTKLGKAVSRKQDENIEKAKLRAAGRSEDEWDENSSQSSGSLGSNDNLFSGDDTSPKPGEEDDYYNNDDDKYRDGSKKKDSDDN